MSDIVVSELTKSFGDYTVLDNVSATFEEGKVTCVMGPSGCGKTTLLRILMGLLSYEKGSIDGVPFFKSAVFQEDRLCESFSAVSNVRFSCDKRVSDEMILSHLALIGLEGDLLKPVGEFSGGMKRRVALVRAILAQSDILFLDEPLKGLDDKTKDNTIQYLKKHINGRTVIMVTHDDEEMKELNAGLLML